VSEEIALLDLEPLELRRPRANLIYCFKIFNNLIPFMTPVRSGWSTHRSPPHDQSHLICKSQLKPPINLYPFFSTGMTKLEIHYLDLDALRHRVRLQAWSLRNWLAARLDRLLLSGSLLLMTLEGDALDAVYCLLSPSETTCPALLSC
jgi:hypothetical protein